MEPKYLLIVKVPAGLVIRDTPRPESAGGRNMRAEPVGKQLYAYDIHTINGVPYARLVPQVPEKPEWCRVREADGSKVYVEVIELNDSTESDLTQAVRNLTDAVYALSRK